MENNNIKTVISVTGNGSFKSQYGDENGLLYAFIYTLENEKGKQGTFHVNHKKPEALFKQGDKVEFKPNGKTPQGENKAKLSKPQPEGGYKKGGNYESAADREKAKYPSFALAYAKDVIISTSLVDGCDPDEIADTTIWIADKYLEWLNKNS
jgi:hypothetical protein